MIESENVKENLENVHDLEEKMVLQRLKEELRRSFSQYQQIMRFMATDAPIAILCLPSTVEKLLVNHGCLRVYDVFNLDLAEIKGLSASNLRDLTARINQFFSML